MSEISFAKTFLSALDACPRKLSPDYVEDLKSYPARPPVRSPPLPPPLSLHFFTNNLIPFLASKQYTLPKMPKPMSKRVPTHIGPGHERSVTVRVRSLRNPPLDVQLPAQPLATTSVLDVKVAVAAQADLVPGKIRVLHKKKPVPDSKVLKDLVGDGETTVEFSVMVMGGAAAAAVSPAAAPRAAEEESAAADAAPVAQGQSGAAVLETDAFWTDLRGFLLQRIRDEQITEELFGKFLSSWETSRQ